MNQTVPPSNPQLQTNFQAQSAPPQQSTPVTNQASYQQTPSTQPVSKSFWSKIGDLLASKPLLWLIGVILVGFVVRELFFKPAMISVIGTGRVKAEPAQVEMIVSRIDSDSDPVMALVSGEENVNRLVSKTRELAGSDVKIQKSFYQVSPSAVGTQLRYQVVNVFKITANNPSLTSDLIKGLYGAGATSVSNVNFIAENKELVTQQARQEAIDEARRKAKNIAKASGKRVGRIVSVSEDQGEGGSSISTNDSDNAQAAGVSAQASGVPSEIDVTKSMSVTYNIW